MVFEKLWFCRRGKDQKNQTRSVIIDFLDFLLQEGDSVKQTLNDALQNSLKKCFFWFKTLSFSKLPHLDALVIFVQTV